MVPRNYRILIHLWPHIVASPELWSTAERLDSFHLFIIFKLFSALHNTRSLLLSLCPFNFFTFCPFSKYCGCCSFSCAILSLFWGFFPNEWRLHLEAFQNTAIVADPEKMFVFGLCIHFVMSPEKFWMQQFAMTSEASPLPAFSKRPFLGHFEWLNTNSCLLFCFISLTVQMASAVSPNEEMYPCRFIINPSISGPEESTYDF